MAKLHSMSEQLLWPLIQPGQLLGKARVERLLASSAPPAGEPSSSVYLRPGDGLQYLGGYGPEGKGWAERLAWLDRDILKSGTGLIALRAGPRVLVILPPFPVLESSLSADWNVTPLLAVLETEYTIGVVLLRLGRFFVAVCQGEKLVTAKTDTRYVKGRHSAGGTSQKRFQRIREGQVRRLYDKACEAVRSQFGGFAGQLDYVLLGGDKFTVDGFLKVCPYLDAHRDKILDRLLNIRDPKRNALDLAPGILSESRLYPMEW